MTIPRACCQAAFFAAVAIVSAQTISAHADDVDPWIPGTIHLGTAPGPAPGDRFDARRTGQASTTFPERPVEVWRRQLAGGIDLPPVIDGSGGIIVAQTTPEIVRFGPDGKEAFRVLLDAAPATSPAILSSGLTFVVTTSGRAFGIRASGTFAFSTPLGIRGRDIEAPPLTRGDGGAVIAAGRELVVIDASGVTGVRALLPGRAVGALLEGPEGILATTETGEVWALKPPLATARNLGSFGAPVRRGAVRLDARTLLAVVEGQHLVALDLPTGTTHRIATAAGQGSIEGPPTIDTKRGLIFVTNSAGQLFGIDAGGGIRTTLPLDPTLASLSGSAAIAALAEVKSSPPLVLDAAGKLAFARISGRVGVVTREGAIVVARERLCATPIAVLPAGPNELVVACRDGAIWKLGTATDAPDVPAATPAEDEEPVDP